MKRCTKEPAHRSEKRKEMGIRSQKDSPTATGFRSHSGLATRLLMVTHLPMQTEKATRSHSAKAIHLPTDSDSDSPMEIRSVMLTGLDSLKPKATGFLKPMDSRSDSRTVMLMEKPTATDSPKPKGWEIRWPTVILRVIQTGLHPPLTEMPMDSPMGMETPKPTGWATPKHSEKPMGWPTERDFHSRTERDFPKHSDSVILKQTVMVIHSRWAMRLGFPKATPTAKDSRMRLDSCSRLPTVKGSHWLMAMLTVTVTPTRWATEIQKHLDSATRTRKEKPMEKPMEKSRQKKAMLMGWRKDSDSPMHLGLGTRSHLATVIPMRSVMGFRSRKDSGFRLLTAMEMGLRSAIPKGTQTETLTGTPMDYPRGKPRAKGFPTRSEMGIPRPMVILMDSRTEKPKVMDSLKHSEKDSRMPMDSDSRMPMEMRLDFRKDWPMEMGIHLRSARVIPKPKGFQKDYRSDLPRGMQTARAIPMLKDLGWATPTAMRMDCRRVKQTAMERAMRMVNGSPPPPLLPAGMLHPRQGEPPSPLSSGGNNK